ncbi:hypothetical protein HDU91_000087 [Kappamyces sp. JEL0680]|nr:hypothetical protein HDU91_000087 [Kappamyces sp. JEL0680]
MTEPTSHIHIVTLGGNSAVDSIPLSPRSVSTPRCLKSVSVKRPSSAYHAPPSAGTRRPIRPKSAAVARNKQTNDPPKDRSRGLASKSETPKIHLYPLVLNTPESGTPSSEGSSPTDSRASPHHAASFPVGAHTSGFYTKKRSAKIREESRGSSFSISKLLHSVTVAEPVVPKAAASLPPKTSTGSRDSQISFSNGKFERRISFSNDFPDDGNDSWLPEPDIDEIESCLARLTDTDTTSTRLVENITKLAELTETETEPSTAEVLYTSGALSTLLELLPRSLQNVEVQVQACIVINYLLATHPPANQEFLAMGGLKHLLKASQIASKGFLTNKSMAHSKLAPQTLLGRVSTSSTDSTTFQHSLGSSESDIPSVVIQSDYDSNFRTTTAKHQSLQSGALSQFYSSHYLDNLDKMNQDRRKAEFSKLLSAFQKFDRTLSVLSSNALANNIDYAIDSIVSGAMSILGADDIILYKLDETTKELSPAGYDEGEKFPMKTGLVGKCLEQQELFNIRDPAKLPEFHSDIDCPLEGTPHAMLALPIYSAQGAAVGVLLALNKRGPPPAFEQKYFDEEDEYVFRMMGTCCGTIMGNSSVYESMNTTQKKVTVLLETTRSLASILDLDKLIKVIMDSAKELLSSDRCTLFLHDPERKQLRFIVQGRDSVQEIRIPSNAGIAGAVFTSGVPINIQNAYQDTRYGVAHLTAA